MGVRFVQVSNSAWNINNSYDIGTRVKFNGYMYIALKNVPKGINIGMGDYWKKCDDIEEINEELVSIEEDITGINEYLDELGLSDMTDVNLQNLQDNDILSYDATSSKFVNKSLALVNISETEKVIGTFDGKVLYRKLVKHDIVSDVSVIAHNITDLDEIINICGVVKWISEGNKVAIPLCSNSYSYSSTWTTSVYDMSVSSITLKCGANIVSSNASAYIIIDYTKSESEG